MLEPSMVERDDETAGDFGKISTRRLENFLSTGPFVVL